MPVEELSSFRGLWPGGYWEGDPLDPVARSSYGEYGYVSTLFVIYQVCVRPFIKSTTNVLEIGPGRGAWTRTLLPAREVWCLDALPAEYNRFWETVGEGQRDKVKYIQVEDFECAALPDDHFDFLFSFGCFCHISWEGQKAYYRSLFKKLRPGANAMVMYADFDKFNGYLEHARRMRVQPIGARGAPAVVVNELRHRTRRLRRKTHWIDRPLVKGERQEQGGWCHAGIPETKAWLTELGWDVVDPDIGVVPRDPIVHFRKPG